jgi:hypothetical protein
MENRQYYDKVGGWAGVVVGICLFGGLAISNPEPAKLITLILFITWAVGKLLMWKWG